MRILSLLILLVMLFFSNQETDSPHGPGFKVSCKTCHSSKGWQLDKDIYSFDHNRTKLPLTGQHTIVDCRLCHTSLVFSQAETECNQCHSDVHQSSGGLDCSRCHTPASWLVNNITEIHMMSRFPLLGAHRTADCFTCHKSENLIRFDVTGINCIDCHRDDYMSATNPDHAQAGFSEECSACHPVNSFQWSGGGFSHEFFPLVQAHSSVNCFNCHTSGGFRDAKPDCYSCHYQDFMATKNPDHSAAKISTDCRECHSLIPGWKPTTFDHTSFPLTLGHAGSLCTDCHKTADYSSTSPDCYSCHQADYNSSVNPDHTAADYPTTCEQCHSTNPGWKPATFNHTSFPLTLGHAGSLCTDCHKTADYSSTSPDCYSCHQPDYNSSVNPDHSSAGYPTTCDHCHSTNPGWKPATFNHTSFPLTQGHSTPSCTDCHKNGNYASTPSDCYACHITDYNNSTNPNHNTLAFATVCTQCHNTNPGWQPASYTQHDAQMFPIYSGKHRGQWSLCTECHTAPANYSLFDCKTCHFEAHRNQNYNNAECYSCHPTGTKE